MMPAFEFQLESESDEQDSQSGRQGASNPVDVLVPNSPFHAGEFGVKGWLCWIAQPWGAKVKLSLLTAALDMLETTEVPNLDTPVDGRCSEGVSQTIMRLGQMWIHPGPYGFT
jgi:hypothetical protein